MDQANAHGFNFRIKRSELIKLLTKRSSFHASRASFYRKKGAEFSDDAEKVPQSFENRTLGRHEDEIGRSYRMHAQQAKMLKFVASHLPPDRILTLTRADISEMELLEA